MEIKGASALGHRERDHNIFAMHDNLPVPTHSRVDGIKFDGAGCGNDRELGRGIISTAKPGRVVFFSRSIAAAAAPTAIHWRSMS